MFLVHTVFFLLCSSTDTLQCSGKFPLPLINCDCDCHPALTSWQWHYCKFPSERANVTVMLPVQSSTTAWCQHSCHLSRTFKLIMQHFHTMPALSLCKRQVLHHHNVVSANIFILALITFKKLLGLTTSVLFCRQEFQPFTCNDTLFLFWYSVPLIFWFL